MVNLPAHLKNSNLMVQMQILMNLASIFCLFCVANELKNYWRWKQILLTYIHYIL